MALTAMEIYKNLPKTNCKDCGLPTCMALAMQVAGKQKALSDCPHVSGDAEAALADASAPPMKLVKIGPEGKQVQIGQETVMFRHEEKFHNGTAVAVKIEASLSSEEALAKAERISNSAIERVGEQLKVSLCAVEVDGVDDAPGRVKAVAEKCGVPLVLMGSTPDTMKACVEAVKDQKPLIYKGAPGTFEGFLEIAAAAKVPLAIGGDDPEVMAEAAAKAREKGVEELVLAFDGAKVGDTLRALTVVRRAALKKNFRGIGFPAAVEISAGSVEEEAVLASTFAVKYASIVIMSSCEPWALIPVLTSIQDIYTDPQVPNTVEAKLYEIGSTNENSPVLFTTNFALTYFSVAGEVERSKIPAFIVSVETEGLGVLNAYAGDKISAEQVVKAIDATGVAAKVKHRKLIIPGLLPIFRAEIEDTSEWKEVIIGPETAREIPAFLAKNWK